MAPVSNPLPISLPGECAKAAKIMRKFADPVNGLDSIIPPSILRRAKGFCFMSVAKAGFLFSARAGSGVVIAKLPDGTWSAPSAVGTAGGGFGFQVGVEVAEFFIVLNSKQAVRSFMAKGSITLGGNMSIAAGPLGRNLEGTGSLSSKGSIAAMYSYSRSKGLFGGASVEGAIIVERSDANSKAYGQNVTATQLLSGAIDPPPWADTLISTITRLTNSGSSSSYGSGGYDDPYGRLPIEGDEESDDDGGREQPPTGGYAFGSAYAAGGSSGAGGFSPEREKSRISSMLGSVGRSRSGSASGGSKGGKGEAEDPFASQTSFGASGGGNGGGPGGGGPKAGGEARFETQFSRLEDDSDDGYSRPSFPSSSTAAGSSTALNSSTSTRPKPPTTLSRENSFGLSGLSGGGGGGGGGGKTKLTKTKARSGSANSAGLRERAGQMSWGAGGGGGGASGEGRDSFDSLDDEREQYRRFGGTAEEWAGGAGAKEKKGGGRGMMGRFRSSTYSSASSPVTAFDPSALSSSFSATNANAPKHKSRLRSSTAPSSKKSPFDDDSYSGSFSRTTTRDSLSSSDDGGGDSSFRPGLNRALSKPWDSEDESYFAAPPSLKPHQAAPYASYSPSRPATTALPSVAPGARTPGGHTPLDLREVEADFATAMDLARNGGEAEVGSYSAGTRSRSSTVTAGGGRSRSGTVTAAGLGNGGLVHGERERPAGVGKDGIGWAVGLFDFPGVESTDLPFLKNDLLTLLNRDDAEWWRARKGLREGMVPRNYLEAHFD